MDRVPTLLSVGPVWLLNLPTGRFLSQATAGVKKWNFADIGGFPGFGGFEGPSIKKR